MGQAEHREHYVNASEPPSARDPVGDREDLSIQRIHVDRRAQLEPALRKDGDRLKFLVPLRPELLDLEEEEEA